METLPIRTARSYLSRCVDRIRREQDRIIITTNGVPAAVLISVDDLESMDETLEVLSDPELCANLREAERDAASGNTISHAEMIEKLKHLGRI